MSIQFSANLASLRREKGITQKQAAQALGISQALLSHYEKGIRECNLAFVRKAAEYYDVSADYLLGMTESRRKMNEILDRQTLPSDHRIIPKTVLRCLFDLSRQAQEAGESEEMFFTDFFTLCVKKYLSAAENDDTVLVSLCDASLNRLCEAAPTRPEAAEEAPLFTKTLCDHALLLLNNDISAALK